MSTKMCRKEEKIMWAVETWIMWKPPNETVQIQMQHNQNQTKQKTKLINIAADSTAVLMNLFLLNITACCSGENWIRFISAKLNAVWWLNCAFNVVVGFQSFLNKLRGLH